MMRLDGIEFDTVDELIQYVDWLQKKSSYTVTDKVVKKLIKKNPAKVDMSLKRRKKYSGARWSQHEHDAVVELAKEDITWSLKKVKVKRLAKQISRSPNAVMIRFYHPKIRNLLVKNE